MNVFSRRPVLSLFALIFIAVSACAQVTPTRLQFSVHPGNAIPGGLLYPQPTVRATDNFGVVATGYTGAVTLTIKAGSGKAGAVLSGTTTVNAVAGVADFTGLSINLCGLDYVLTATSGSLASADSNAFDVTPPTATTGRVSVSSSGEQGNSESKRPVISGDGRFVAFSSIATNLVAGDTNAREDIFVHDRQTNQTRRVSVSSAGEQANNHNYDPVISADGRFVAFQSDAFNLVTGDGNNNGDIFVYDLQTSTIQRASLSSTGKEGKNGSSFRPSISADGRYVAFQSDTYNLVTNDWGWPDDIFVRDTVAGVTTRVSSAPGGADGNYESEFPAISGDGRYVAFQSYATNLVAGDTNNRVDIFVHDRDTATTIRVSVDSAGNQSNADSYRPAISHDGRYIAFASDASNLVAGDTNGEMDVFVHDRVTHVTERVSVNASGVQANEESYSASISADGRYVAFTSFASNLVVNDANNKYDVFVKDRQSGAIERASVLLSGQEGDHNSGDYGLAISANGRYVTFASIATNLVSDDTNSVRDIFVRDRFLGLNTLAFTTQPAGATAGYAMTTQPVVSVRDACGDVDTTFNGVVGLTIKQGTGASGAALVGTVYLPLVNGYAVFTNIGVDTNGTDYVLTATCGALPPVDSAPFSVGSVNLVFTTQPGGANVNTAFRQQPVLQARDANNNFISGFKSDVTLAIKPGTGTAGASMNGELTRRAVNGVTTFTDLMIDFPGIGYVLEAFVNEEKTGESAPFDVIGVSDLEVTNTVDLTNPIPGQTVIYTIGVVNNGPDPVFSVTVTDAVDSAMTVESVTSGSGTAVVDGNTVTVSYAGLEEGAADTIIVCAKVAFGASEGPISNTASVGPTASDPRTSNNTATADGTIVTAKTLGTDIPARFGAGALLATQTCPTGFGDNLSELNQLFGKSDGNNLLLGLTGNIENNSGNGVVILLDTKPGGNNPFGYSGAGAENIASGRIYGLNGDTLDTGFQPDYALDMNVSEGVIHADLYDLQANTKAYLGYAPVPGTLGFTGGGELAFNNSNSLGVTESTATSAATATTGWEISLPLNRIGSPTGSVKVMALIQANSDYHSNQYLPGLPATYLNMEGGDKNFVTIPGKQYVTMNPVVTANDLPAAQTMWAFRDKINGDGTTESHPPVVSSPTIYNGRAYVVEDVEHADGTHTGLLVAVLTGTGALDTAFGTGGRVAIAGPATGRIALRYVGGAVRLYFATTNGYVYSMDASNGANLHSVSLGGTTGSTPAVWSSGSTAEILVPLKSGETWYLKRVTDTGTMSVTGSLALAGITDISASPSIIRDGSCVQIGGTAGTGGMVYTLMSDLSSVLNAVATTNPVKASTTLSSDSSLFYVGDAPASGNGRFYCFNATNGNSAQTFGAEGALTVEGAVEHAAYGDYSVGNITNALYFVTTTGQVNAVNPVTGASLSGYPVKPIGNEKANGGLVLLNGILYVPTEKGMYAISAAQPTSGVRYTTSSSASTPSATGRTPGSVIAVTGETGHLYGLRVQ